MTDGLTKWQSNSYVETIFLPKKIECSSFNVPLQWTSSIIENDLYENLTNV